MANRRKVNEVTAPCVKDIRFEPGRLLPGIPDEITFEFITTKIGWRTIEVLSRVNHSWKQAVKDRLIYNTRVRCHSTETFYVRDDTERPWPMAYLSLWTKTDDEREIPSEVSTIYNHAVTLEGKVYRMGGLKLLTLRSGTVRSSYISKELFVLDLAGCGKRWEMCAPTQALRTCFHFGLQDGKIFIYGCRHIRHIPVITAEVYDPNMNKWSSVPLSSIREDDHTAHRSVEL